MLTGSGGSITSRLSYDAYGLLLGGAQPSTLNTQPTSLLYSGEQFDSDLGQYYLRARYYDPSNGRFNRLDPFAGNNSDPQSLHKYAYAGNDPVSLIDPSGLLWEGDYEKFIIGLLNAGETNIDNLWRIALEYYLKNDPEDDMFWDCEDEMADLMEAFSDIFTERGSPWWHGRPPGGGFIQAGVHTVDGSAVTHFFGGASWEGALEIGVPVLAMHEFFRGSPDWVRDNAYAFCGAELSDYFDVSEAKCRTRVKEFTTGTKTFTGLLGPTEVGWNPGDEKPFVKAYRDRLYATPSTASPPAPRTLLESTRRQTIAIRSGYYELAYIEGVL